MHSKEILHCTGVEVVVCTQLAYTSIGRIAFGNWASYGPIGALIVMEGRLRVLGFDSLQVEEHLLAQQ